MEDLQCEQRISRRKRERQNKPLVPYGSVRPGIIRLRGEATIRVHPEDHVRPEFTLTPVDILQVLCVDDRDVEIVELRWRRLSRIDGGCCHGDKVGPMITHAGGVIAVQPYKD